MKQKKSKRAASASSVNPGHGGGPEPRRIHPRWAWHYRVLMRLRERLLKDRGEQLAQSAQPLEPYSMDMADAATDEFDHDMALAELSGEQDTLYEVEEAIRRILDGSYGRCESSGRAIPAARLRAIPWARFSSEEQLRLEKQDEVGRAHLGKVHSAREAEGATLSPAPDEIEAREQELERAERLGKESIQPQPENEDFA